MAKLLWVASIRSLIALLEHCQQIITLTKGSESTQTGLYRPLVSALFLLAISYKPP